MHSFACTSHSFACSALLASFARSATLIRSLTPLTHSLAPHCSLHSLALRRSFIRLHRSLAHCEAHGKEIHVFELNASSSYLFYPQCCSSKLRWIHSRLFPLRREDATGCESNPRWRLITRYPDYCRPAYWLSLLSKNRRHHRLPSRPSRCCRNLCCRRRRHYRRRRCRCRCCLFQSRKEVIGDC